MDRARVWTPFVAASLLLASLLVGACQLVSGVSGMSFGVGGATGSGAGGDGGANVPSSCKQASDCPPVASPCEVPVCVGAVCGAVALPAGSNASSTAQTLGDCQVLVCNGDGKTSPKVDDADVLDDGSDCTVDACVSGVPTAKPRAYGTTCGADGYGKCDDTGACVECLADVDCGLPSECASPTCNKGLCDAGFVAEGTALSLQVPGDCQQRVCDGKGKATSESADADVPDDGLDCTDDVCAAGVPSNSPRASGQTCGNVAGMSCDGNGTCKGCTQPTDCAGADDECRARTCSAGACGVAKQPAGTKLPASAQTSGDCRAKACDVLGLVADIADEDPPPDDGNACTTAACVNGTPAALPTAQGAACDAGGGKVCDGSGACVACNSGADCDLVVGPCQLPTCTAKACAVGNVAVDQPAAESAQTAGDCAIALCDGAGATKSTAFDADVPVDGEPCTEDVCSGGKPSNPPEPVGAFCQTAAGGKKCDGKGHCVQCFTDADCKGGKCLPDGSCDNCKSKSCTSLGLTCGQATDGCGGDLLCDDLNKNGLETDVDCGGDKSTCPLRCGIGQHCLSNADCSSGACAQGICCNVACDGACRSCAAADTGGKDGQCGFITKGQDPLAQCGSGQACDGSGSCKKLVGQACGLAGQCLSGFCPSQDGVCCDQTCNGACAACSSAKTGELDGTCAAVLADTDPDSECAAQSVASCGRTGVCDGGASPACKLHEKGVVCKTSSCDPLAAKETAAATCDGAGKCEAGAVSDCKGYVCGPAACKTSCAADADCVATHYCSGGSCFAKKAQGAVCGSAAECLAGSCRDGYCCNSACTGTCEACASVKTGLADGACGSVLLGTDPDNECAGGTPICSGQSSCAACGATLVAPGGVCPAECTGGCNAATKTCSIDCSANDAQCLGAALTCPEGWNCRVACSKKASCKSATITCPSDYSCSVECGGGGENESCASATVLCANGNCNLACKGATNRTACKGAVVNCGGNACKTTCDAIYSDPAGFPTMTKNDACGCTNCGVVGCK